MQGIYRTRVGYAGGSTSSPTYRNIGDHTETIQIDYNPEEISYEELLDVFWRSHSPEVKSWSRQYMSAIFYHNAEQKELAEKTKANLEKTLGKTTYTRLLPASKFFLAEDYHQKYRLRQHGRLVDELKEIYPDYRDLTNSTAAARLNGYLAGHGTAKHFKKELGSFGLSEAGKNYLRKIVE